VTVYKVFFSKKPLLSVFLLVLLSVLNQPVVAEEIRYISDKLSVAVRSGATNQHRIVKFLSSGTAITVLDSSEDGKYLQINIDDGKTGWVLAENTMLSPSGRAQLVAASAKLEKATEQQNKLKQSISELQAEIRQLKKSNAELQSERTNLSNSLEDIKVTAANPLALSRKNSQLKSDLDKVRANEKMLLEENQQLRTNVQQEWFIIGGGVSIGSLILGLILTRINWRRKRDSWGDSF
jgi:SH3 domain protein